jgi:hypothetical protein|tara:strand:- start:2232 stop:2744 length:513 start_codon:yes stop_codon:yes gene_type:complete
MTDSVYTLNLSEDTESMVPIDKHSRSNAFVPELSEKNVSNYKDTMDSTPIADVMTQPQEASFDTPMMGVDPRAVQMAHQQVMMPPSSIQNSTGKDSSDKKKKNPFDLTDEQLDALIVLIATGVSVSKPIQEKLASTVPKFLNNQGNRSFVGLASTGAVAAIVFYVARKYF